MKHIRFKITALRLEKGWTKKDLAQKSKLSAATICDVESGKKIPSSVTLEKISKAFNIELVELLDLKVKEPFLEPELKNELPADINVWLNNPENIPFIKLAHTLSNEISPNMIKKLKYSIDFNTNDIVFKEGT